MNKPWVILICCEGTSSENKYFEIVIRYFRINNSPIIKIIKGQKQHKEMIDRCIESRERLSDELLIKEEDIETWAVCDRDSYSKSFTTLDNYAKSKNVLLAFSDPQFETFLLQHLEQNKTRLKGSALEKLLSEKISQKNLGLKYAKGDFSWLDKLLDKKPKTLLTAIQNARRLDSSTNTPFLTVWMLVERLLEFGE